MLSPSLKSKVTFFAEFAMVPTLHMLGLLYLFFFMDMAPVIPEALTSWKGGGADFTFVGARYFFHFFQSLLFVPFFFVLHLHVFVQILLHAEGAVAKVTFKHFVRSVGSVAFNSFVHFLSMS